MENKKYPPYLFDVDFDSAALPPEPEVIEEEPAAPTFSGEELQAARDTAFEAGKAEGIAQSNTSLEQQINLVVVALQNDFASLCSMQQEANDTTMRDAVKVATTIVSKVLPQYIQEHGASEIEAFVRATLSTLFAEADVTVRAPEATAAALAERLTPVADALGLAGKLEIAADPALGPADCRMEWGNGGAERNAAQIMSDMDTMVSRFLEHGDVPENTSTPADANPAEAQERLSAASEERSVALAEPSMPPGQENTSATETADTALRHAEASPSPETFEAVATPEESISDADSLPESGPEVAQTVITPAPEPAVVEQPEPEPAQTSPVLPTLPGAIDTAAPEQNS